MQLGRVTLQAVDAPKVGMDGMGTRCSSCPSRITASRSCITYDILRRGSSIRLQFLCSTKEANEFVSVACVIQTFAFKLKFKQDCHWKEKYPDLHSQIFEILNLVLCGKRPVASHVRKIEKTGGVTNGRAYLSATCMSALKTSSTGLSYSAVHQWSSAVRGSNTQPPKSASVSPNSSCTVQSLAISRRCDRATWWDRMSNCEENRRMTKKNER